MVEGVANALSWCVAAMLFLPVALLALEVVLAARRRPPSVGALRRPRVAIVIPAHDEESEIGATLDALFGEVRPEDRVLVVADNCSDATAEIARSRGATVLERRSETERGKGYALAFGVEHLAGDPPEVVVFLDADSRLEAGSLDDIASTAAATGRPAQAIYLMDLPKRPSPKDRVSAFAFFVKNDVRPRGLAVLSLPCHLTGTGMAWPFSLVSTSEPHEHRAKDPADEVDPRRRGGPLDLRTGSIVEDLELGLRAALAGAPPVLCPNARVYGRLPARSDAALSQRRRWEHGFLATMLAFAPRALAAGIARGDRGLVAIGLDLLVPPLSLLALLAVGGVGLTALLAHLELAARGPALVTVASLALLFAAGLLSWRGEGRRLLPLRSALAVPLYVAWKIPIYLTFLFRRERRWVRTPRDADAGGGREG